MPLNHHNIFDIAIIGGGINGCGCAADAALRGLSVALCEQGDLGAQTSSASSKLIHGGLRYLEQYDFLLVKHALDERQRLLDLAPHLVQPLKFMMPHISTIRSYFLVELGLSLYDHLSLKNKLPHHEKLKRETHPEMFLPLKPDYKKGFSYYDARTDDCRLVIENALQAQAHGAQIFTRTSVINIKTKENRWILTLQQPNQPIQTIEAKALINASGACVQSMNQLAQIPSRYRTTLIQGTHLIVPRWYTGDHAYVLQHSDQRIVFVIPYQTDYLLIGTTETPFEGDPLKVSAQSQEIDYLIHTISHFFNHSITEKEILHTTSGVRTLVFQPKDPRQISRDWAYDYGHAPLPYVTIYSGKLTTYRKLAEEVINQFHQDFKHMHASSTAHTPLPGSVHADLHFDAYQEYALHRYAWLDPATLNRYLRTYGTRTEHIISHASQIQDLGVLFGPTFYQAEADYLIREEWVTHIDDLLWRRTKLGLKLSAEHIAILKKHYQNQISF